MSQKSDYRRAMLSKVHIAKKDLALADDSYRALLGRVTGKSSAADLSDPQLDKVLGEFKRLGWKPKRRKRSGAPQRALAQGGAARKARALWLSAWNLGIVEQPDEKALAAFVKRQTGRDALQWVTGAEWFKVIEALKAMCVRDGGVNWAPYASTSGPVHHPQARVMEAQWRRLHQLGKVRIGAPAALSRWAGKFVAAGAEISHTHLGASDARLVIAALGECIRRANREANARE